MHSFFILLWEPSLKALCVHGFRGFCFRPQNKRVFTPFSPNVWKYPGASSITFSMLLFTSEGSQPGSVGDVETRRWEEGWPPTQVQHRRPCWKPPEAVLTWCWVTCFPILPAPAPSPALCLACLLLPRTADVWLGGRRRGELCVGVSCVGVPTPQAQQALSAPRHSTTTRRGSRFCGAGNLDYFELFKNIRYAFGNRALEGAPKRMPH